jgi:hypothetical protein
MAEELQQYQALLMRLPDTKSASPTPEWPHLGSGFGLGLGEGFAWRAICTGSIEEIAPD